MLRFGFVSIDVGIDSGGINPAPTGESTRLAESVDSPRTEEGVAVACKAWPCRGLMDGVEVGVFVGVGVGDFVGVGDGVGVGVGASVVSTIFFERIGLTSKLSPELNVFCSLQSA